MNETRLWQDVDDYFDSHLAPEDEVLRAALRDSDAAGLPSVQITATQGKFLHLLAGIVGARNILEIGTLGGYSAIWMARALPEDGRLTTLEYEPRHAEVAVRNIARAGLEKIVDVRVGAALETLPRLAEDNPPPFDLVFVDADKAGNPHYVEWALKLTRAGSVIVVDNVVRGGTVTEADSADEATRGTRATIELIADHPRLSGTAIQTVGGKGYDGFALARVLA
ncbi:O-methyltransferase [Streptomyces sp. HSG2]|uniref:O-methyltransferase n=1 Tax=Streptomyces sp. HSG2 TaxID=2797167 RepID=UPI001907CA83|nr:O-methyltransferase [Streptomyces sp. HSG2]